MSIDYEVHGDKELQEYLSTFPENTRREMRDLVEDLGEHAEAWMRLYAPRQRGPAGGALHRRITHTGPADRGATTDVIAGVLDNGDKHPLYVLGGTGIYSEGGTRITPNKPGGRLTFQKHGEPRRFRMSVKGQKSNPYAERAYHATELYAQGRVAAFSRELGR